MNLLYSNYLKGSYVAYVDGALTDYRTSNDNTMASYFADLQPNTTYTLTRITNTSRFRVATFYTDVKNSTGQIYSIAQWWLADSYNTITFTTGPADTHLVVYYTNSSQYDAQIMLNEGSVAEPYEAPAQSFTYAPWTGVEGEYPSNGVEPAPPFSPPYPAAMWRIDGAHNNGYPWHELLRGIPFINLYPELRENVIRVYDKNEPQSGFTSNGLAILHPTSCVSIHNDDRWDITLRHPIDQWGKWRNLLVVNVLKVDGQLFRIKRQKPYIDSSGRYIEVEAKHITTDLADESCFDFEFPGGTPAQFISEARAHLYPSTGYEPPYNFSISAHGDTTLPPDKFAPASLLALLVGLDNSLLNRLGGELYRDNFELIISPRMAYAKDDAFNLRYSLDMVEISQEVDYSDFCTLIHCYDNWGGFWSASYAGTIWWAVHHQIVKVAKFNYAEYGGSYERLVSDGQALADKCFVPKVTYKVKMAALKNDPKYKDFLELQNYRYGDSGTIYCPELDISTKQKIVEIERNELTGEIISMTLGNMQSSVTRPTYLGSTLTSGHSAEDKANAAMQEELQKLRLAQARTWFGIRPYTWAETKTYKWEEYR